LKILAIGAHPDDIELGAGGTIARHVKNGDEVIFLILTYGEKTGSRDIRKKEALMSAKKLNVKFVEFAGFPDTEIPNSIETINAIEQVIEKYKPQRVYTHCVKDIHQDHRAAAYASISAARKIPQVFSFESPLVHPNFTPQYFIDITDTIDLKIKALKCFKSQKVKEYLKAEAIEGLAKFRGFQAGIRYAEAFEVIRVVKMNNYSEGL
jgi:LmbE family N-acetylglucosaminyl deacetylase